MPFSRYRLQRVSSAQKCAFACLGTSKVIARSVPRRYGRQRQQASRLHSDAEFVACIGVVTAYGSSQMRTRVSRDGRSLHNERDGINVKPQRTDHLLSLIEAVFPTWQ
jgi:hypothetical protein